jgi:hypothetical protein
VAKGYRSVLDRSAIVVDKWPAKAAGEFQRKVRTLAGNYQLISLAPWILGVKNRLWFQLVSHKLLRLVVPYLLVLLLVSALWLSVTLHGSDAMGWRVFAALEGAFWLAALLALRMKVPLIHRIAAPASALLVLNVAAVVGLYKFLFTAGPLWKIWSVPERSSKARVAINGA